MEETALLCQKERKNEQDAEKFRLNIMRNGPRIKIGVRFTWDYWEAMQFDKNNRNELWEDVANK